MAAHILSPLPIRRPRFLLAGAIAVALLLLIATFFGIQAFSHSHLNSAQTSHPNSAPHPSANSTSSDVLAVITNSGSTNLPGLTLTVNKDGSGSLHFAKNKNQLKNTPDRSFPAGTFDAAKLAALLNQVHDVSTIPNHSCLKSISFGTTTTITYQGKTSGDLSCLTKLDGQTFTQLRTIAQDAYRKLTHSAL